MKNTAENVTTGVTTELVFILDRSGSMHGLEKDTIGGFNSLIDRQKEQSGGCFVSTVLFDDEIQTVHDRLPLEKVPEMTGHDYFTRGCTALLDAIGETITHIETIHKYIRPEDVPERTMFVIITDGMENASKHFSHSQVKRLIEKKKEADSWEFLFIGANIDAVSTADSIGIDRPNSVNYHADSRGTGVVYGAVNRAVCAMRACARVSEDWNESINADFESRK